MAYGKKTGGRIAGTPNKSTAQFRERLERIMDKLDGTIDEDIDSLEPKERLDIYIKLCEFVLPKLARINPDGTSGTQTVIFNKIIPPLPDGQ